MSLYKRIREQGKKAATAVRQAFRGRLSGITPETPVQFLQVQGLAGETLQGAELFQHFGLTSSPPDGTQCIVLPLNGKTVHSVIVATENGAFRIAVSQGETCLYNQWGAKITLKREKIVEVDCDHFVVKAKESIHMETKTKKETASQSAAYSSPALSFGGTGGGKAQATMHADIQQTGGITSTEDHTAGGKSLMSHVHPENDNGGPTGSPV